MPSKGTPTPQQISTLMELFKLGASGAYADASSVTLGKAIGRTQQAASARLLALEKAGLVTRAHSGRSLKVRLTPQGLGALRAFYGEFKGVMERTPSKLVFSGSVFTGFKEGGYYVSLEGYAKHFRSSLGFIPFPGTLNLKLRSSDMVEKRGLLESLPGIEVKGFEAGGRTYGPVKCFLARVGKLHAAVLAIERTHYDHSVLEVISPRNLRKSLKLEDGDKCDVAVFLD